MQFLYELESLLKEDQRFISEDGEVLKTKVYDAAMALDKGLLSVLLKNDTTRHHFFTEVEGINIFDKVKFSWVLESREFLPDSYTKYKNKIGLVDEKENLISKSSSVSLVWPYKDCVLEGGQTKDEERRKEIFYNEILAPDEVNRLLYPKVFTEPKRYNVDGVEDTTEFTDDDNLIVKGNNLLVISSLLRRYEGQIRCIYIDPPYNTGNDSFGYNDTFLRSTWLTFMKNRLEIAHRLLHKDGFIFIQCDDFQNAYLKVLMDDIFGEENYRNSIYWHRTYAGKTVTKKLPWNTDTILMYSKMPSTILNPTTANLSATDIKGYNKDDNDGRGKYNTVSLQKTGGPGPETTYDYVDNNGKVWKCPAKGWRMRQSKLKALENDNRLYITDTTIREKYYLQERLKIGKQIDNFWTDLVKTEEASITENENLLNKLVELADVIAKVPEELKDIKEAIDNFWADIGNMNRVSDVTYQLDGQKPEQLIKRIISLSTKENDIVLDFFMGTGTTCATAMKMGRRFIGVEQMDYIDDKAISRLKTTIEGDQTGISKEYNWQGGGSFVYCELKELNESYIKRIQDASSSEDILAIKNEILNTGFVSYRVDISRLNNDNEGFLSLALEEQKKVLLELIDKNKLYVNYCDIDDEEMKVADEEKQFTHNFYGKEAK